VDARDKPGHNAEIISATRFNFQTAAFVLATRIFAPEVSSGPLMN